MNFLTPFCVQHQSHILPKEVAEKLCLWNGIGFVNGKERGGVCIKRKQNGIIDKRKNVSIFIEFCIEKSRVVFELRAMLFSFI